MSSHNEAESFLRVRQDCDGQESQDIGKSRTVKRSGESEAAVRSDLLYCRMCELCVHVCGGGGGGGCAP